MEAALSGSSTKVEIQNLQSGYHVLFNAIEDFLNNYGQTHMQSQNIASNIDDRQPFVVAHRTRTEGGQSSIPATVLEVSDMKNNAIS